MSETMDCVCFTKDFLKLLANFEFVYCCHGNMSRKDQTAKMVLFGKIIAKKENKPK